MSPSLLLIALAWASQEPAATVRDLSHPSQVLASDRPYRVVLPPSYAAGGKRYPVVYWLNGYEQSSDDRDREIAAYVAAHDVIVVSFGPVETTGAFPLYFPELVQQVDSTLRTIPDRDHRGVTGVAMGGFMALWTAGKFPDLVASASSSNPFPEASVGPANFPADCGLEDGAYNYDAVRTLPLAPGVGTILDFHAGAFSNPLPKPAAFNHADVYPNFMVWGWEAASDRRQPGFTVLENVSAKGFRSAVREWVPSGAALENVKLSITSAPRLYPAGAAQTVTYIRLRDGNVRRAFQKADAQGRLSFELDGNAYEVGVSSEPLLTASGYEIVDAAWATAGKPVTLKVKFWNKGAARSTTTLLKWESPTPGVQFAAPASRLYGLAPGESAIALLTFTAPSDVTSAKIVAVEGASRMPLDVPLFPLAEPATLFQIADGVTVSAWRHGMQHVEITLGEGNRDNHAAPGESFGVLFPEGEYLRAAELFTTDTCVDNTVRASDSIGEHASVKYSLPSIRADCEPGHVVHMLARVVVPGRPVQYWSVEFPVWYRP